MIARGWDNNEEENCLSTFLCKIPYITENI